MKCRHQTKYKHQTSKVTVYIIAVTCTWKIHGISFGSAR